MITRKLILERAIRESGSSPFHHGNKWKQIRITLQAQMEHGPTTIVDIDQVLAEKIHHYMYGDIIRRLVIIRDGNLDELDKLLEDLKQ